MNNILPIDMNHLPVMLEETLENLNINQSKNFFDGTLGFGGHSEAVTKMNNECFIIGVDRDLKAIKFCKKNFNHLNISLHHDSYENIDLILNREKMKDVNAILLDLGLSSYQLDNPIRGFSYRDKNTLDMRFDNSSHSITAAEIISNYNIDELTTIFKEFGEERHSYLIAKKIKDRLDENEINSEMIVEVINSVTPFKYRKKTYSRIFQALRIETNHELEHLKNFLSKFINYLSPGGRVIIISYHSIEDRLVKHSFKELHQDGKLKIITKKPLIPSENEISYNSRSRSAKMRIGEKIG